MQNKTDLILFNKYKDLYKKILLKNENKSIQKNNDINFDSLTEFDLLFLNLEGSVHKKSQIINFDINNEFLINFSSWSSRSKYKFPKYFSTTKEIEKSFRNNKNVFLNTINSNTIKEIISNLSKKNKYNFITFDIKTIYQIEKTNKWGDYEDVIEQFLTYLNFISLSNKNIVLVIKNFFDLSFTNSNNGFLNYGNFELIKQVLHNPYIKIIIYSTDHAMNLFAKECEIFSYFDKISVPSIIDNIDENINKFFEFNLPRKIRIKSDKNIKLTTKYIRQYSTAIYRDCEKLIDPTIDLTYSKLNKELNRYFAVNNNKYSYEEIKSLLNRNIKSQKEVINIISKYLFLNLNNYYINTHSFLFLGESGVGKTELSKQIAKTFYNNRLLIIDCTKIQDYKSFVNFIIDDDPKNSRSLFNYLKNNSNCFVLFDEIEKSAYLSKATFLGSMLSTKEIISIAGDKLKITNTIFSFTSNLYSSDLTKYKFNNKQIFSLLSSYFGNDFINNLDEFVYFNPLRKYDLKDILLLKLDELSKNYNIILINKNEYIESLFKVGDPYNTLRYYISLMNSHFYNFAKDITDNIKTIKAYFSFETNQFEVYHEYN
ncbi:AAA family ATPase [Mycoplasma sp. 005V]|uniref:AAA family ATPase n=1 Tax=unclassified Mycoplasma TaxID=2683645 RepID=UPI003A85F0C1